MAHGDYEYNEWLNIMQEAHAINNYLGEQSKQVFDGENYKLNKKHRLLSAKIQDLNEDIKELKGTPASRKLDGNSFVNRISAHVAGGLTVGTALALMLSSQNPDINQAVLSTLTFGTAAMGGAMGFANNKCYQKKPISNAIKQYVIGKKERALNKSKEELAQLESVESPLTKLDRESDSYTSVDQSTIRQENTQFYNADILLKRPFKREYFDCIGFHENLNINDDEFTK